MHDTDQDMQFLPTRLIDISIIDRDLDAVRLIDTGTLAFAPKYITLSHCWGAVEVPMAIQLMRQNISALERQILVNVLPQTFRDMILISRSLQTQYIWIDSLYIVQDDKEDWKTEAAKMWQIYSNAYVNIAATSSSNSSQGLFRQRGTLATNPCIADVREGHPFMPAGNNHCYDDAEWTNQIGRASLNKRAWVQQEWLLSDRVIHFARDQVFWECQRMKASERYPNGIPSRYDTDVAKLSLGSVNDGSDNESPKRRLLELWSSVVGEYSTRALSHISDKLIAISAVARILSRKYPNAGIYVAGI
ncbi:MAG: hypothetical protein LQ343_004128 [Gyalolechia ehrenbergii]|nr:MAG: hypothetical protein LQ343_004128 [Gyalolechia ehrenbergii]